MYLQIMNLQVQKVIQRFHLLKIGGNVQNVQKRCELLTRAITKKTHIENAQFAQIQ